MRAHTTQSLTASYAAGLLALLLASIAVGICPPRAVAEPADTFPTTLGVAWYPEQWPKREWENDLILMEKAHIHVVRVGEFAWSRLEPHEGSFDLDWLEEAIDLAGRHGIRTVLGTPTAAPPAWLTAKYPQTLRVRIDGTTDRYGGRQQFSFADSQYRRLCREMVRRLALRFGNNPNVIGWQLDNEIGEPSFDRGTQRLFENWLQNRYKILQCFTFHL